MLLLLISVVLTLKSNITYQEILGFGGAFTDAAGINILNLTAATQLNLLKSYFSPQGKIAIIEYIIIPEIMFSSMLISYWYKTCVRPRQKQPVFTNMPEKNKIGRLEIQYSIYCPIVTTKVNLYREKET